MFKLFFRNSSPVAAAILYKIFEYFFTIFYKSTSQEFK